MTLRRKLMLWHSGLLAVIIILFGSMIYGVTRWMLVNTIDMTLRDAIVQVWQNSSVALIGHFGLPNAVLVELPELDAFRASGIHMQVWEVDGNEPRLARASSNIDDFTLPLDVDALHHETARAMAGGAEVYPMHVTDAGFAGKAWRVATTPFDVLGRRVIIQAAVSMEAINLASRGLLIVMVGGSGLALIGSVMIGKMLSDRALKPITTLTDAAARISTTDDLGTRLPLEGPMDELGHLTTVFNTMMARLQHLFSVQQRFIADVSHELRTPLTAIQGNVDLIKHYGADGDSLEAIEGESKRMGRMVNDLLLLARADYGGLSLNLAPVDLDEIVSEVYRDAKRLIKDRALKLTIRAFEPIRVKGDADRLKQLLLNVVTNAIKFTPDGGEIIINLHRDSHDAILEVRDTGIGIGAEDLKRVFDRFFQAETSRARGDLNGHGTGLGLSIAKWIADAHGGSLRVDSEIGSGTTLTFSMPHLEAPPATPEAVTRPRLGIIRRATGEHRAVNVAASPSVVSHQTNIQHTQSHHVIKPQSHTLPQDTDTHSDNR